MNTAKKFLALALTAYAAKQFEEAGCLFAQAAECSDVTKLTDALLQPVTDHLPENQDPITADNQQQLASDIEGDEWGDEDETPEPPETDELAPSTEDSEVEGEVEDEDTESTEETDEESESTSSGAEPSPLRRRVTSMYQIGKILAASMEATSADDSEHEDTSESEDIGADEEDDSMEPDPDIPGERLVPVSFSSVTVKKGLAVNSPVKLKQ